MRKMIVLFQNPLDRWTRFKLVFQSRDEWYGKVYHCFNIETRSGLHWHYCRDVASGRYVHGPVRLVESVASYTPAHIDHPRMEGKNVWMELNGGTVEKFKAFLRDFVDVVAKTLPGQPLLEISTEDGVEIWLYHPYDVKVLITEVARQANLLIYAIEPVPKAMTEIWFEGLTRTIVIGNHTAHFNTPVQYTYAERRQRIEAVLAVASERTRATLLHPEHGRAEIELEPGWYLFTHFEFGRGGVRD